MVSYVIRVSDKESFMYSKRPVWLIPEDILKKYRNFCFYNNISERRLVQFYETNILSGVHNKKTKKIEIIEESFELLQNHIQFNRNMQSAKQYSDVSRPQYLNLKYEIFSDNSLIWYTPKEILERYSETIAYHKHFTTTFIGDLTDVGLVLGRYNPSENCYNVLCRSFLWLLKYRKFIVDQNGLLFPPESPQA